MDFDTLLVVATPILIQELGGGWVSLRLEGDRTVHVRFGDAADGRLVALELYIADGVIDAQLLKSIPLQRLEAVVNQHNPIGPMREFLLREQPSSPKVPSFEKPDWRSAMRIRRQVQARVQLPETRGRYPDAFYEDVAHAYGWCVANGEQPAVAIADANEVAVNTVRRWIKEARRRGALPAGRQGRAG